SPSVTQLVCFPSRIVGPDTFSAADLLGAQLCLFYLYTPCGAVAFRHALSALARLASNISGLSAVRCPNVTLRSLAPLRSATARCQPGQQSGRGRQKRLHKRTSVSGCTHLVVRWGAYQKATAAVCYSVCYSVRTRRHGKCPKSLSARD